MLPEELGYRSLFAYCVEALGMSEGTAGRRVTAARMCRRFPEAFARVARGELHLCALCALAPHVTVESSAELFEACRGKTRRKIEELLAARFPRPDVREQIRRLPVRAQETAAQAAHGTPAHGTPAHGTPAHGTPAHGTPAHGTPAHGTAASEPMESNSVPSPVKAASTSPEAEPEMPPNLPNHARPPAAPAVSNARRRAREVEPLSPERFGVHFTADAELRELIERARALARHRLPNGDLAGLMKLMAASFVRQEEKRRFGIGARQRRVKTETNAERVHVAPPRTPPGGVSASGALTETETETETETNAERVHVAPPRTPPGGVSVSEALTETKAHEGHALRAGKRGRYLPVTVRREAYTRDDGRCAFVSAAGRRCTARAFLELDHIKPVARFGGAGAGNIRLLCRAHNLLHARRCFGKMHIEAKIAKRKRAASATRMTPK